MFELTPKYAKTEAMVTIRYATGNGDIVESPMPAHVALEIINRADKVERSENGFEMVVNDRWFFPAEIFFVGEDKKKADRTASDEKAEEPSEAAPKTTRKRTTKA